MSRSESGKQKKNATPIIGEDERKINMEIRLKSLHLENFKCHNSLTLDFDGKNASIYGDNATGKTSIYDAFVWLLFGKDSTGNGEKNIDIKPLAPDGSVRDHQAVTEVEAVLLADGEEVSLKRTYREEWATRRGSSEAVYVGNTSDYFVDGVPCKANAYKTRVSELVDEEKFRLLTTVSYFSASLPWQKRREALFDLFGSTDDRQIMGTDERFAPLLEAMGRRSLEDTRAMLTRKRKDFTTTRNEVPARISECEKTIADLSGIDFDDALVQVGILSSRRDQLQKELLSIEQNTAVQSKQLELREAQMELDRLEGENRQFRESQKQNLPDTGRLADMVQKDRYALDSARKTLSMRILETDRLEDQIRKAREEWMRINAEQYTGSDLCPTCGQKLPDSRIHEAVKAFAMYKKSRLDAVVSRSESLKELLAQNQKDVQESTAYIENLEAHIADADQKLQEARKAAESYTIADMDGYADRKEAATRWISNIKCELDSLREDAAKAGSELRRRISEVNAEIKKASEAAGKRGAYEYAKSRIAELREDARAASDNLAKLDRLLFLMDEYSRYKAGFVEQGINNLFRIARFRLFREQANGGVEDRCDVVYDGVPYLGLNNGMKINVGMDIINTLSRAYGVSVPLFVDNAESVTCLEKTDCQVVRLVVSENDKELRIEHEN